MVDTDSNVDEKEANGREEDDGKIDHQEKVDGETDHQEQINEKIDHRERADEKSDDREQVDEKIDQISSKRKRDESPEIKDGESAKKFCGTSGSDGESSNRSDTPSNNEGTDKNEAPATEPSKDTSNLILEKSSETDVNESVEVAKDGKLDEQEDKGISNTNIEKKSNDDLVSDNLTTDETSQLLPCDADVSNETEKALEKTGGNRKQNDDTQVETLEVDQTKENSSNTDNTKKSDELGSQDKKKTRKIDSEIIDGVELLVECASDQESSDESEHVDSEPRKKTLIIREQPNDSEFDDHCSEEEKSDTYQILEPTSKSDKQAKVTSVVSAEIRTGKNSKSCIISNKSKDESKTQSDGDDSSVRGEGTKLSRRSRGRGVNLSRNNKRKSHLRARSWEEDEDENDAPETSDEEWSANKQSRKKTRSRKSFRTGNDGKRNPNNKTKSKKISKEEKSADSDDDLQIEYSNVVAKGKNNSEIQPTGKVEQFKNLIRAAGLKVKCYETLFADCRTEIAKVERLSQFLQENGIKGRPTLQKCIKFKEKNENASEVMELDTRNIIADSEGRVTRGRRSQKSHQESKEFPTREPRTSARKISIVDDDSE